MEYWFFPENKDQTHINKCLDSQLYSGIYYQKVNHFTNPRIIIDIKSDTIFESVEAVQALDKTKKWLINPLNIKNEIDFELIKQIVKNKKDLPHIELAPMIHMDDIKIFIIAISYGVDYVIIKYNKFTNMDAYINKIKWVSKFRDKGKYKTKIMICNLTQELFIARLEDPCYDGVYYINDILQN